MLNVITIPVTPYQQNCRILVDDCANDAVCVDPGGDIPSILAALPAKALLSAIWITHSHIDHVSGVNALIGACDSPLHVVAHADDEINRQFLPQQANMMQFEYSGAFNVSQTVNHHDVVSVGEHEFQVLHTPGHAIGHVSLFLANTDNLYNAPMLLAGDALFQGSIGRTDLPGGNHQQLIASIQNELFCLPEQTVVCPGHGPSTTIGHEKKTNPFF